VTFRGRLRLFFAILVIVPVAALGAVLLTLSRDSAQGKADAHLSTALSVAQYEYRKGQDAAADDLRRLAGDDALAAALRRGDRRAAARRLERVVLADRAVVSATLFSPTGSALARAGSRYGVAPAAAQVRAPGGKALGVLAVSVTDARRLVESVQSSTLVDALVLREGRLVAGSEPGVPSAPDEADDFEAAGERYRGRRARAGKVAGRVEQVAVVWKADQMHAAIGGDRLLIAGILLGFLALALAASTVLIRSLQSEIGAFLRAARNLANGRFDQPVPVKGNDEFAQLGREFNNMSTHLEAQIREVERRRFEVGQTIRRVGDAFASGLDPQAAFELTVQTALSACEADAARGLAVNRALLDDTGAGEESHELSEVLNRAAARATAGDCEGTLAVEAAQSGHALALQLCTSRGAEAEACVAVVAIARREPAFSPEETELLTYLATQAAVSIENADLHEQVQLEAVTDELTGLANLRQMHVALERELERGRRFDTAVGFVLLDVDDFKRFNDTYGHQQGDEVLRQIAAVLRGLSREIDEPARYGGEELAVVLPQTPLDGAARLAERMRAGIEALRIPRVDGEGEIRVTASFGVASASGGMEEEALIAAADAALYCAKRGGKNRVELAEPVALLQ